MTKVWMELFLRGGGGGMGGLFVVCLLCCVFCFSQHEKH